MSRTYRFRKSYQRKRSFKFETCEMIEDGLYLISTYGVSGKRLVRLSKREVFDYFNSNKRDGANNLYSGADKKYARKLMQMKLKTYNKREMRKAMDFNYDAVMLDIYPRCCYIF